MEGTTNINELGRQQQQQQQQQLPIMDDSTRNELLMGIQKLKSSSNNPMYLTSRDIPSNTESVVLDQETVVNYIPKQEKTLLPDSGYAEKDYLEDNESNRRQYSYMESFYDDLQMPIFVGVLYFGFQLPLVKKYLYYFFPNLFAAYGLFNLGGYLFTSVLFSLIYYIVNKLVLHLN